MTAGCQAGLRHILVDRRRRPGAASRPGRRSDAGSGAIVAAAIRWAGLLAPNPFALAALAFVAPAPAPWLSLAIVAGLLLFGFVFAVNSAVH